MSLIADIILQIELHSPEGIRNCFENGINPNIIYNSEPLIYELISEYTRSPQFKDCVKVFTDFGLQMEDKALLAVLLDDEAKLESCLQQDADVVSKQYSLRCAYTPLHQVNLLHICAEFNHTASAVLLVKYGADINAVAGFDEHGFGGQTPVFHTVNQNNNQSADMLDFLLSKNADTRITAPGFIWGKGYEWETLIPAVNPVSYAMMGLLPQMHRDERIISDTVSRLLKYSYGIEYKAGNVPNKYLSR